MDLMAVMKADPRNGGAKKELKVRASALFSCIYAMMVSAVGFVRPYSAKNSRDVRLR